MERKYIEWNSIRGMRQPLLSVIIPVFNGEEYIKRCLESVVNQTYRNLEIIVINDGSTDGTGKICLEYARIDKRIEYIEQTNHGVAYAKRRGIELAEGEYIGFVDADDFIDADMYEKLLACMDGVELVTSGFFFLGGEQFDLFEPGIYDTEEQMQYICENMVLFEDTKNRGVTTNLCNKLFKADILKKVVESTTLDVFLGEDAEIVYKYILRCNSINVTRICAYHYEYVNTSITHSINEQYMRNVESLYFSLKKEFENSKYNKVLIPKLERWIWCFIQDIPLFLGWKSIERFRYMNPYTNLLENKKIILYGAGAVGKDYFKLNQRTKEYEIVGWVDRNWEGLAVYGMDVCSVEQIIYMKYDYILIAVKQQSIANEIKQQLLERGIPNEKILWKTPIELPD